MAAQPPTTEGDILERIIAAKEGTLTPAAARSLLGLKFPSRESARIRRLLRRNNAGTIDPEEVLALENYLRVGQLLDLLHAKAKLSLAKRSRAR